jgi:hypothetical protein
MLTMFANRPLEGDRSANRAANSHVEEVQDVDQTDDSQHETPIMR